MKEDFLASNSQYSKVAYTSNYPCVRVKVHFPDSAFHLIDGTIVVQIFGYSVPPMRAIIGTNQDKGLREGR